MTKGEASEPRDGQARSSGQGAGRAWAHPPPASCYCVRGALRPSTWRCSFLRYFGTSIACSGPTLAFGHAWIPFVRVAIASSAFPMALCAVASCL